MQLQELTPNADIELWVLLTYH